MDAALRVVRYLKRQPGQGYLLACTSDKRVTAFCDVQLASFSITMTSVTSYMIQKGNSLVSWKTKKQTTGSKSSTKAKYSGLASIVF